MKEQMDLLQKIATDVAVIKNEIEHLKKDTEKTEELALDVKELQSKMKMARWIGGVLGASIISLWVSKFKGFLL